MAKPKPQKNASATAGSRRDKLASFEAARKRDQRRRTVGLLAICLVLALALLAYPVYLFVDDARSRSAAIEDIGASVADAGCTPSEENPAAGNQQHVEDGTKVTYDRLPPDSGPHYATSAPFTKKFYTAKDRPPVEQLVHNLEHGYSIVWYREGAPSDQIDELQRISKTFNENDYTKDKFIAAPWTAADGGTFPEGKNVVLAHWYADPADPGNTGKQKGVRATCSAVSGQAIKDFLSTYPSQNAPEPSAG